MAGRFNLQIFCAILVIVLSVALSQNALAYSIQVVTDRGNVFVPEIKTQDGNTTNSDDKTVPADIDEMINGFGVTSRLIYKEYGGNIIHADRRAGTMQSLQPYNPVSQDATFAAAITSADKRQAIRVPEFQSSYSYASYGGLEKSLDGRTGENFAYSEKRTLWGDIDASHDHQGTVTTKGWGRIILKMPDYYEASAIRGTMYNGATVRIVESPYDLMNTKFDYGKGGFLVSHVQRDPTESDLDIVVGSVDDSVKTGHFEYDQQAEASVYHGKCCKGRYTTSGSSHQSVTSDLLITSDGTRYLKAVGDRTEPQLMDIGSILKPGAKIFDVHYNRVTNFDHKVYDTLPVKLEIQFPAGNFEARLEPGELLSGQNDQKYLIVDAPYGGISKIYGKVRTGIDPLLSIDNLPPDTAYRLSGDGGRTLYVGTTYHDGRISLGDYGIYSGHGGILELYTGSPTWVMQQQQNDDDDGSGTIIFDHINDRVLTIQGETDIPHDQMYSVHAYVKIPITAQNVTISQIRINDLRIAYLDGIYNVGDSVHVPVIPTYNTIHMMIEQIPVSLAVEDVLGGSNVRIADTTSSTVSIKRPDAFTGEISSTAGAVTFMISNTDGNAKVQVQATVSGDSQITNTRKFADIPPPPPPPTPRDPLSTWIEVYVNGQLFPIDGKSKTQIFFSDEPVEMHTSGISGFSTWHTADFEYPPVRVVDTISVPVNSADFVEVYFYVRIDAEGSIPPVPPSTVEYQRNSEATATAILKSASIIVSM